MAGEREVAPGLTFQDGDNRVKINSQAPVVALALVSLASQFLSLLRFGDRKVPFRSWHALPPSPAHGRGGGSIGGWFTSAHACSATPGRSSDALHPAAPRVLLQIIFHVSVLI